MVGNVLTVWNKYRNRVHHTSRLKISDMHPSNIFLVPQKAHEIFPTSYIFIYNSVITLFIINVVNVMVLIMEIPPDNVTDEELIEILKMRKIAVVGMSRNPNKAAHTVPRYLLNNGYEIYPVNPKAEEILGLKVYKSLKEVPVKIDIVDVFRPSEEVLNVVKDAIEISPKVIWLQKGIYNKDAVELAKSKGIKVVWNRCMYVEHSRLKSYL